MNSSTKETSISNVHDVAVYILEKEGKMTAMKLQKLVYYSQALGVSIYDTQLFNEEIQAWANGPVVPVLYDSHKGKFMVSKSDFQKGDSVNLTADQKSIIDEALEEYRGYSALELSEFTHNEDPWKIARKDISDGESSKSVISIESIRTFYSVEYA